VAKRGRKRTRTRTVTRRRRLPSRKKVSKSIGSQWGKISKGVAGIKYQLFTRVIVPL